MSLLKVIIFILFCMIAAASCTSIEEIKVVSQYFDSRKPFHAKRHLTEQQYFIRARERIKSEEKLNGKRLIGKDGSLAKKEEKQYFAYDATLTFDTVNIDMHPDVLDIGCSRDRVYLKMRTSREAFKHIAVGSLLVSSMDDFQCEIGQPTDEPVLYRLVLGINEEMTEKGELIYVIDTKKIEFNQVFTHIKLSTHQPNVKQQESSSSAKTTPNKRWSVNRSFDLVNFNYDKDKKSARNPSIENQEGNFKYICTNCYFYSSVRFTLEINFRWCKPVRAAASVYFENGLNTNLTMTAEIEKTKDFKILKKKKITSLKFAILAIPVIVNVNFALEAQLQVQAKIEFNLAASFSREGQFGFNYDKKRGRFDWIRSMKGQDLKYSFKLKEVSLEIKLYLIPVLGIDIYGLLTLDMKFKPWAKVSGKYLNPADDGCRLSYESSWGMDGSFHIGKMKFKKWTIFDGRDHDWTFINERQIKSLSGCWIKEPTQPAPPTDGGDQNDESNARSIGAIQQVSNSTYYKEVVPCCNDMKMLNFSQNSTLIQVELQVSDNILEYGQYLVLNLTYDKVATVQYGNVLTYPVEKKVYVVLTDVFSGNDSSIIIRFSKELSETVLIDYYMERTILDIGNSVKMKKGFIDIQEPEIRPDYMSFSSTNGQLKLMNSSTIIQGTLMDVSNQSYPLRLEFIGEGTLSIYPVYNYKSGDEFAMLIDRSTMFGIKYSRYLINGLKLSHLHIYSNNDAVEENANLDVNVKMLHSEQFSLENFDQLSESQAKFSLDESVSSEINYFYFEVSGNFGPIFLGLELIDIYDVTPNAKDTFTLKYSTSSPFIALLNFTELLSNSPGISIKTDGISDLYIDESVPTNFKKENAMWMSGSESSEVFGLSEYSNEELIELGSVYMRIEPTASMQTRNLHATVGQLSVQPLKSENITVKFSFKANSGSVASETVNLSDLMNGNVTLIITIQDDQYSFDSSKIENGETLVNFLSSMTSTMTSSRWDDTIIPVVAYAINVEGIDLVLENPQTLVLTIPKIPPFESMDETITLSDLDSGIFLPTPRMVKATGKIKLVNNILTNGFIGTISASVIGFVLVFTLLLVIVAILIIKGKTQDKKSLDQSTEHKEMM